MTNQTIQTPIGEIKVEETSDPIYPGVYVSINGTALVLVEYSATEQKHVVRVWSQHDPDNDPEYTQVIEHG